MICFHSCIQVARLVKFAILFAALLAYYYLSTSMTLSNCKALDVRAFYDLFSIQTISRLLHAPVY